MELINEFEIAFPGVRERGGDAEYDGGARVDWPVGEEVGRGHESRASGAAVGLLVPRSHSQPSWLEEILRVRSFGVQQNRQLVPLDAGWRSVHVGRIRGQVIISC